MEADRTPTRAELRWFGAILLAVFGIVGGVVLWQAGSLRAAAILWGAGALLTALYYGVARLRLPLYRAWMGVVLPIGWAVSQLLLGAIYFGILTPIGLVMRLFRRDALRLRLEPDAPTYWTEHDADRDPARYLRQS